MPPSHGQFKPPAYEKGDESTIGGYVAVDNLRSLNIG